MTDWLPTKMLPLTKGRSCICPAVNIVRYHARGMHVDAKNNKKSEEDIEKEYYEREKRGSWLTPLGLRKTTFATSLLTLGLLPCLLNIHR